MPRTLFVVDRVLARFRIGNIAVAAAVLLMPLVLAIGFLTDHEPLPGHGISARAGLQATLDLPMREPRG
jgi:hypothetical protein